MKNIIRNAAGFICVALLQTACYEDKGNYDYHTINSVEINIPETKVRMPKEAPVEVIVIPEISQTLENQDANLTFQWKIAKAGTTPGSDRIDDYEDLVSGKECKVVIEPNQDENIGLLLIVSDKKNGTNWYRTGQISIIKPFNPCWFVLQEQEGEQGVLGVVEGNPKGYYIFTDVFQSETGTSFPLQGKPLSVATRKEFGNKQAASLLSFMGFSANPALVVVTNQATALLTPSTLAVRYSSEKILFEPAMQGKPIQISSYKMDKHGELYSTSEKNYFAHMDGFCVPYSVKREDSEEALHITAYGSGASSSIFFEANQRHFLKRQGLQLGDFMSLASVSVRRYGRPWQDRPIVLRSIGINGTQENVFDPEQIDPTLQVKDIVSGSYGNYLYAVAIPNSGNELTVFQFSEMRQEPACFAKHAIALPNEIDLNTAHFAASYAYTANLLFMSSGNKLYRIDLDRNKVTEIYRYEDETATISCLKFKNSEDSGEFGKSLGLGVNVQNKGFVVELQLTPAGDVSRTENSVCIYKDDSHSFSKIVDIAFNYE